MCSFSGKAPAIHVGPSSLKAFRFRAMTSVTLAPCSAAPMQTRGRQGPQGLGLSGLTWRLPGLSGRRALRLREGQRPARSRDNLAHSACRELSLNICDSFISHSWMSSRIFAPDCERRGA